MVILESILANWSFRRKPEMDLLGLLARKIPWFIALYAVFKVGTLIWQWDRLDVFEHPGCTVALAVEMTLGILMPGIMLLIPMVRRSPGWLGFASLLLVLGVVINRVNVFLVGFHPPFVTKAYFPTFGEIALTAAMVATIMLAYRFFALNFPILLGSTGRKGRFHLPETEVVPPFWSGFFRIASVVFLLGFIGLYAVIHGKSIQESEEARKNVYFLFGGASSRSDVEPVRHTGRPGDYQTAFLIKTPLLTLSDDFFGPVRFSHRSHDNFTGGNCALCHHRIGMGEDDREGMDIEEMHAMMDLRLGPPCATCHGDLEDIDLGRCGDCHGLPNEADFPSRLGLKGAYHRQCMGCHEEQPRRLNAPMDCKGCHRPIVPDHHLLVEDLPEDPSPKDISGRCLECHMDAAGEVLESVHWLWGGHSPHIVGYEHHVDLGLETVVNNYLLCAGAHSTYCSSCHISFGRGLPDFDSDDPAAIDCFSCHDTTGTYRKAKLGDESSGKTADLVEVSQNVGAPTRATCGQCHFYSDGGANLKHGDLEPILEDPPNEFDVHMGRNDMSCQECHKARGHKIAGRSMTAPAVEGIVRCVDCHGEMPHGISGILSSHLDDHVRSLACETCHIPTVARETPTRVFLDYSQAGQDREPVFDADGKPTYDKELGEMKWARNLVPVYAWFDGSRDAYVVGEEIDPSETTTLNAPTGDRRNPASKIFPFKIHTAIQPYDTERDVLLVPKLCGSYWKTFDWDAAIREGMEAVGQEYSGSYGFTETKMYTGIHHQVVPKEQSLGCADCHEENAVDCGRCHRKAKGQPIPQLGGRTYAEEERRLDFEALGYEDDPARVGGRFYTVYGKGTPSG